MVAYCTVMHNSKHKNYTVNGLGYGFWGFTSDKVGSIARWLGARKGGDWVDVAVFDFEVGVDESG